MPLPCSVVTRSQSRALTTDSDDDSESSGLKLSERSDTAVDGSAESQTVDDVDKPLTDLTNADDRASLIAEQKADATLDPYWRLAARGKGGMFVEDDVLYHQDEVGGHKVKQLCVPHGRRLEVMRVAHDAVTAAHLGGHKTRERIRLNFFWPNLKQDVTSYINSCRPCQLRPRARRDDRVPITPIVRPTVPFVVCHADVIGPIEPPSAKGHKWALTVIDDCSRWPAVVLLRNLTAKSTCDAFLELFSVTGWPEIICTDRGTNFCSKLTQEFLTRMGVTPKVNSPMHPEASGVIERFNGSFKQMLHHAIHDYGRQWHKVVPCLVWALREVPNSTTSVSPHFLLFGRVPRGPLSVLKEAWVGCRQSPDDCSKPVSKYIQDLEVNMRNAEKYARQHAAVAQQRYAKYHNVTTKDKMFRVGDQVVVLEKDSTHKTFARWKQGKIAKVRPRIATW